MQFIKISATGQFCVSTKITNVDMMDIEFLEYMKNNSSNCTESEKRRLMEILGLEEFYADEIVSISGIRISEINFS